MSRIWKIFAMVEALILAFITGAVGGSTATMLGVKNLSDAWDEAKKQLNRETQKRYHYRNYRDKENEA